jgi:hypothetical protein
MRSPVIDAIERGYARGCTISVYFDDFIGSGPDQAELTVSYNDILASFDQAHFQANPQKLLPPAMAIRAFNCDLSRGLAEVTADRIATFYSEPRSHLSAQAFRDYCARVARNNAPAAMLIAPAMSSPGTPP